MDSKFLNGDDGIVIDVNEIADGSITDAKLQSGVTVIGEANKIVKTNSSGNLVINSTSAIPLDITSSNGDPQLKFHASVTAAGSTNLIFSTGRYITTTGGNRTNAAWKYGVIQQATSDPNDRFFIGRAGIAEDFNIFRDGNVSINSNTNPSDKLYVNGTGNFAGSVNSSGSFTCNGSLNATSTIGVDASWGPRVRCRNGTSSSDLCFSAGIFRINSTTYGTYVGAINGAESAWSNFYINPDSAVDSGSKVAIGYTAADSLTNKEILNDCVESTQTDISYLDIEIRDMNYNLVDFNGINWQMEIDLL